MSQIFSDERDVMPEGAPIPWWQVGCGAWIAYKIGCLLILFALFLVAIILAKMIG